MTVRALIQNLTLKYASLRTLYTGGSEVRHYRNNLTGGEQVGKRICIMGLEEAVAVREAKLLQCIRHDNLVPVFDVAHVDGYESPMKVIEIIMPFYPRGSLTDAFERGERFSVGQACLLAQAVLRGLGELHDRHRMLHRDLKSPNVFLTNDETLLKVGDLGVASPLEKDGTSEPYPSMQIYTPPETYQQQRVTRTYDLYAVGLLLLELLNGPFPYDTYTSEDMRVRLHRGRSALRPAELELGPHIPKGLRRIIRKAISSKPTQRPASAGSMSSAISRVHLIDWGFAESTDESLVWMGAAAWRKDRQYRVAAVKRRKGWVLSAYQNVNRLQRVLPDRVVADPRGRDAASFFDQVLTAALKR